MAKRVAFDRQTQFTNTNAQRNGNNYNPAQNQYGLILYNRPKSQGTVVQPFGKWMCTIVLSHRVSTETRTTLHQRKIDRQMSAEL